MKLQQYLEPEQLVPSAADRHLIGWGKQYDAYLGVHAGVKPSDYHAWPGVSSSFIARFLNPKKYLKEIRDGHTSAPSESKIVGTIAHAYLLENSRFESMFHVLPKGIRCDSLEYCNLELDLPQKELVRPQHYERGVAIGKGCQKWPSTRFVHDIPEDDKELTVVWRDPETGILCKAKLDILNRNRGSIDDIKTDRNPHELEFPRTIRYHGYHVRLAHYLIGTRICLPDLDIEDIRILAIKNDSPYHALLYVLPAEDINYGLNFCVETLKTIQHCCFHGWPGPEQTEIHLAPVSI